MEETGILENPFCSVLCHLALNQAGFRNHEFFKLKLLAILEAKYASVG